MNINAGTLTVGGSLYLNHTPTSTSNRWETNFVITSGTVNVGGDLNIGNAAGADYRQCEIYMSGGAGTFNLGGNMILGNGIGTIYSGTTSNFNYNGTTPQTVQLSYSRITYANLKINSALATLSAAITTTNVKGNLLVQSGILNNNGFGISGNSTKRIEVYNGAELQLSGTSGMPTGFGTKTLGFTSNIHYRGNNQTVSAESYGNLILSGTSGAVVKTFSATALTIANNFSSLQGTATSVSYTSAAVITFGGDVNIGSGTTFNASSQSHSIAGNITNSGTLTGSTGTITVTGTDKEIAGAGSYNFNNLTISGTGTRASADNINIAGNFATTGSGSFLQNAGTTTMTGASKTISGINIDFYNLTISGSITSTGNLDVFGNLSVNTSNSFIMSAGSLSLWGSNSIVVNYGTLTLYNLTILGNAYTRTNLTITFLLDVTNGTFLAQAGVVTFTNTSLLSGTADLFSVTIGSGATLQLNTDAVLGIAGVFTRTGTLNVTTTKPNTVHFNGTTAQNISAGTYHHLMFTGAPVTAIGALTINGNFSVNPNTTFSAATYTHTVYGNFLNNGTFTANTSTIAFLGTTDSYINGITTFNILTVNKSTSAINVVLEKNITAATVNMTLGNIKTGSNALTITTTRTGAGIILGTIIRNHTFLTGVAYEFEGQNNTINFTAATGVTSVKVNVTLGSIGDFPNGSAINRMYDVSIPNGTYSGALRLHYEDAELNGNAEANLTLFKNNGSWVNASKTTNNATTNFVELVAQTNMTMRWTLADGIDKIVSWNGSVSSNWATASNWTAVSGSPSLPPSANEIVQIGYSGYVNAPMISTAVTVKSVSFGNTAASNLSLSTGGSLTVSGNINGTWVTNMTHTINTNNQNMTVNGNLILSDTIPGNAINLNIGTGTVSVLGSLTQAGGANIIFSGAGNLSINGDYFYSSGTFTPSTGTVTYNGSLAQSVAPVTYNHLTINKTTNPASINTATTIGGNLAITSGQLALNATTTINGNVSIATGTTLTGNSVSIVVKGNWSNAGTFTSAGTATFNGTGAQSISASSFNNLTISKTAGIATLTGNAAVAGNLAITAGTLDLATFTANRNVVGGTLTMSAGCNVLVGGSNNFPSNYTTNTINTTSNTTYNGIVAQTVASKTYGNLLFSGTGVKTAAAGFTINGNITINTGATFAGSSATINLLGNWTNSGTYTAGTSTINLNGITKTLSGNTTFSNVTCNGKYTISGSNINTTGTLWVATGGFLTCGTGVITASGNFLNNGSLVSTGTVTFTGTVAQTIQYSYALQSTFNVVNFNGSVAPIMTSTSSPTIATLNVNNTAGISTNVDWTVTTACTVALGSTFNGGVGNHIFNGSFVNNGTVSSNGQLTFSPSTAQTIVIKGTNFTSTGTVVFGGTAAMNVSGVANTLTHVVIDNSVGVTPTSNWTVSGDFTINPDKVFNALAYTNTIAGNFQGDGILNAGTSTFTLTGANKELYGNDDLTFYDLRITGTIAATGDFRVGRNFTNDGTYDGNFGTLIMAGNQPSNITGTAASFALAQVSVQKTPGTAVNLLKNITVVGLVDVTSGILDLGTSTVTEDAVNLGSLVVSDSGYLKIGGLNSIPVFTEYILDSLSTVDYVGTTQTISKTPRYGNLKISTTGTKTANGGLFIRRNFTLANATFVAGNYVDTLAGNWLMTSGTFTNTGSTILFNGLDSQYVSSTGAFNNITLNKTNGAVVLSNNNSINGVLNFILGKIVTGNNTLILSSTASVNGAAQSTGWVIGKLQKNVAMGSNVTRVYELGSETGYTPFTFVAATVLTSGNITGLLTGTDHPNIATSTIEATTSVNKYWTLINSATVLTTYSVTINWLNAEMDSPITPANFITGMYNAGIWTVPATAGLSSNSVQITGLITFGDFIIGEPLSPKWNGTLSTDWHLPGNWSSGAIPGNVTNITIPSGLTKYPIIGANLTGNINNLIIKSGATLTITGTLTINGTISAPAASITADLGTIEMKGTVAQTIPAGAIVNNLNNLIIDNAGGVTLQGLTKITNVLTIKNGRLNTGDNLELKSNSVSTARVGGITSTDPNPIVGNVTVERYVEGRRKYRLITSPVTTSPLAVLTSGQEAQSIWGNWQNGGIATPKTGTVITGGTAADGFDQGTNNASLYTYNAVTKKLEGFTTANGKNTKRTPLKAGVGYYMFVYGDRINSITSSSPNPTTLVQKGTLLTGDQVYNSSTAIPVSPTIGNYSLIGNPYACTIDWKSVAKTNISKTIWGWDANLSSTGGYVTVTATTLGALISPISNVIAVSRYVQPGQAFYVQTTGVNPQMVIAEKDKVDDNSWVNSMVFRGAGVNQQPLMAVNLLYNNGFFTVLNDGAVLAFDSSYSNKVNDDDGLKFFGSTESIAVKVDTSMVSINARNFPVHNDTIPLSLSRLTRSQYTLQIFANDMPQTDLKPWLYDGFSDTYHPLSLTDTNYVNFTVNVANSAAQNANRFKIIFRNSITLPVTFGDITANKKAKAVEVKWNIATENNIEMYELQRSADGLNYKTIAQVASKGNSASMVAYNSVDENPYTGYNYYRIKSIQLDHKITYSKVVSVKMEKDRGGIKIFPNPIKQNIINIQINDLKVGTYQVVLFNVSGQKIADHQIEYAGGNSSFNISVEPRINKGVYALKISNETYQFNETIIIQ